MRACDVMTAKAVTIAPNAPLHVVAETMVESGVTGLPVVNGADRLLGIVTESDLLHRLVATEQAHHGYLWGLLHSMSRQADDFARTHGQIAADVMTLAADLVTATRDTSVEHVARLMEERRIRHMPVLEDGRLVGLITRAHLVRAALQLPHHQDSQAPDNIVRSEVRRAMRAQPWADTHFTFVDVKDGVVTFSGLVLNEHVERGLRALAEEVPGVRDIVFATQRLPRHWIGVS